jgi:hypothetical protein
VWRNSIPMSSCIVRTRDVRRLKFRPDINTPEIELFARLSLEGPGFVFVPEYLTEYRSHAGSETARALTLDRLAEYLEAIEVPVDVEPAKRACLQRVLAAGVGIRLARRDIVGARRLCKSRYYAGGLTSLVQRLSLSLPEPLAAGSWAAFRRIGRLARDIGRKSALW